MNPETPAAPASPLPAALMLSNPEGAILGANRALADLYDGPSEQLIGTPVDRLLRPLDPSEAPDPRGIHLGFPPGSPRLLALITRAGNRKEVLATAFDLEGGAGEAALRLIAVADARADTPAAEEEQSGEFWTGYLRQHGAGAAWLELSRCHSHDLRGTLQALLIWTSVLEYEGLERKKMLLALETIRRGVRDQERQIERFLKNCSALSESADKPRPATEPAGGE